MAAMIACKRAPISKLLEKLLNDRSRAVARSSPSAIRSFNTNAQMSEDDSDEEDMDVDSLRSGRGDLGYRSFFPDVFAVFNPTHSSLSQVLNLMDQMSGSDFTASECGMGAGTRRGWDVREDADALHVRVDMPGLGKEHVKVSAEQNMVVVHGEGEEEGQTYGGRIELPEGAYKMEGIKAEMKNGVLKVTVPKVKQEERKDVFQVKIE